MGIKNEFKEIVEIVKSVVGILAILVGAWWTYDNFLRERKNLPHGNIEHIISHLPLTEDINLLSVVLKVTNSGNSRMEILKTDVRIQQVLPILPCAENQTLCAKDQVNIAIDDMTRREDRFAWTKIGARRNNLEFPLEVEPGETEYMDFEFAIPADIRIIRIYSWVRNEAKTFGNNEWGWHMSNFYQLPPRRPDYD